jgi:hypothetical protein
MIGFVLGSQPGVRLRLLASVWIVSSIAAAPNDAGRISVPFADRADIMSSS